MSIGTRRLALAACTILLSAGPALAAGPDADQPGPWALLHDRCEKCHNSEDWAGEVAFDTMSPDDITADAETWEKAVWATDVQRSQLTVSDVADRMFVIGGGGGNVTVFNSAEGVLLVDGGAPERSAEVLKLVRQRTGTGRVHTLINTHWHWDQTGSNLTLGRAGTRIIAHENTRLWLGTDVDSKWQHRVFKRLPPRARPNETFYTTGSLSFGGQTLDYGYLPQAHTDGDIYVHFKESNILVAGDVLSVGAYPVIDYCTNGWLGGMVNATKTLRGICDSSTRVIPGSGPPQAPGALDAEHDMLAAMKLRLSRLLAEGMSAKDMLDAGATHDYDAQWGDPTLFVTNAWPGLVDRARELGVSIV